LNLSRSWFYEHALEGGLPFVIRRGRRVVIHEPGLRAWMADR
jgi:hypothetical protein